MPYDDPGPDDPNLLVGVILPAGEDSVSEMAYAFAEEFAALGFDEERLMTLFRRPFYAGAHRAFEALGEGRIREIVTECVEVWGRFRVVVRDAPGVQADGCEALRGAEPRRGPEE